MITFIMLGRYSANALKEISAERTNEAVDLIKKLGGEVHSMYALFGEIDLAFVVDFPGLEQGMKASIAITKQTGISFTTLPAMEVEDFDRIMSEI
ncbi:MAG: GYD domain-containing protein [bacterium]|nr:GYD domain-containing protein [bacterium]